MEIFWLCQHCESTNNYEETKVCNVCGGEIDQKSEERCIYEVAGNLYEKAVTSKELFAACEQYLKVLKYKDARQKHSDCKFKAEKTLLNEKIYEEAKGHFKAAEEYASAEKWNDAVYEFTLAEQQFKKTVKFLDSNECASACLREIELCKGKQIYFDAKKILTNANSIEEYKKAAELFSKILKFADAKESYELCLKFIEQLTAKQQFEDIKSLVKKTEEESDLNQKIAILRQVVGLENSALSNEAKALILQSKPVLEDALKQQKAIKTKEDLEEATKKYNFAINIEIHSMRLQYLEKILTDYNAYSQTAEFKTIFSNVMGGITETKRQVDYDNAVDMMNKATTSANFKSVAEAFSRLSGFKDSDLKKNECSEKSDLLAKEATYEGGLEIYEEGRKITIFNWRKYR